MSAGKLFLILDIELKMPYQSWLNVIWEHAANLELLTWSAFHGDPRHTWAMKRYIRELARKYFYILWGSYDTGHIMGMAASLVL